MLLLAGCRMPDAGTRLYDYRVQCVVDERVLYYKGILSFTT